MKVFTQCEVKYVFLLNMASREYRRPSDKLEGRSKTTAETIDSDSWSDISDHLDCPVSYDPYSRVGHSYHTDPGDLSERLYSSLDLGHGSFYLADPTLADGWGGLGGGPWSLPEQSVSMTNGSIPNLSKTRNHKHVKSKPTANGSTQSENEQSYGMKTKFLSAWNNMRHGKLSITW